MGTCGTLCGNRAVVGGILILQIANLRAAPIVVGPGFEITEVVGPLRHPTQLTFGPDGRLFVATQDGIVLAFDYGPDGVQGPAMEVATGIGATLLGVGIAPDGAMLVSSNEGPNDSGFLARMLDTDGDGFYEVQQRFVVNLPNEGHHNDQIALCDNLLFVGMGSRTDDGERDSVVPVPAATVLVVDLNGVNFNSFDNLPAVYAYGFRNPFGITIDDRRRVWVGDNGRDSPLEPEKLHLVVPGAHHGFPVELAPADAVPPVLTLGLGTSADGMDFYPGSGTWGSCFAGNLFIARFDYELDDPGGVGMDVVRVRFDPLDPEGRTATASVLAKGFSFPPLDVEVDPWGNLLIAVYGSYGDGVNGSIWRISRTLFLPDVDCDGDADLYDFVLLANCLTNPGTPSTPTCKASDLDGDNDVDLADFSLFQIGFLPAP